MASKSADRTTALAEDLLKQRYRENKVKQKLDKLLGELGYDVEPEWQTGSGPVDFHVTACNWLIEAKGTDGVNPDMVRDGEKQFEQVERYVHAEMDRERMEIDFNRERPLTWLGSLTDGRTWHTWEWRWDGSDAKYLPQFEDGTHFRQGQGDALVQNLKRIGSRGKDKKPWAPKDPSAIFLPFRDDLRDIYRAESGQPALETKQKLWRDMLAGSGMGPRNDHEAVELFIAHTLLIVATKGVVATLTQTPVDKDPGKVLREGFTGWVFESRKGADWARRIFGHAAIYDWRRRTGDVFRNFYEKVIDAVDKELREAFGEYYTPDWLAQSISERLLDEKWMERSISAALNTDKELKGIGVLDPACGSGTFLYHAAMRLREHRLLKSESLTPVQKADCIARLVHGIEIHPVAVEISKATLLRVLPTKPSRGVAALNIHQGDSLIVQHTATGEELYRKEEDYHFTSTRHREFTLPHKFIERVGYQSKVHRLVEEAHAGNAFPADIAGGLKRGEKTQLRDAFQKIEQICEEEGNSVWAWYIINAVAPRRLEQKKVDRITANPPWVRMSKIQSEKRKESMVKLAEELGVWGGGKLATSFDVAALFMLRCENLYLTARGKAAWLVNAASIKAGSWEKVQKVYKQFNPSLLDYSLLKAAPFHGAACCVWIRGEKSVKREAAVNNQDIKNNRVGRSYLWDHIKDKGLIVQKPRKSVIQEFTDSPSDYTKNKSAFRNGATIFPQVFVVIEHIDKQMNLVTKKSDKGKWAQVDPFKTKIGGGIPDRWVRDTLFSEDLLPFCTRKKLIQAIIPITIENKLDVRPESASSYWRQVEKTYKRHHGVGKATPKSLLERLNYNKGLEVQLSNTISRVVYNASGNSLRASIVDIDIIVEHKCYYGKIEIREEAYYLLGLLNADSMQSAYVASQKSDRDFETHLWKKVPISRYSAKNPAHQKIADLARQAEQIAVKTRDAVQGASEEPLGQIKLSKAIREAVREAGVMQKIDEQVKKILPDHAILSEPEED